MHHKRHKPNPKQDDYRVNDTSYRAGRAYAMHKKREPLIWIDEAQDKDIRWTIVLKSDCE